VARGLSVHLGVHDQLRLSRRRRVQPQQNPLFIVEGHASRNLTPALWVSADAYYNTGGETSIDGAAQNNAAHTLRLGVGMGLSLWRGGDVTLNYDRVVAKPAGEPDAQAILMKLRQVW